MTLRIKSPGIIWLSTEIFENSFGTISHLIYITGRIVFKISITDTAPNVSHSLIMIINILVGRLNWTA